MLAATGSNIGAGLVFMFFGAVIAFQGFWMDGDLDFLHGLVIFSGLVMVAAGISLVNGWVSY